jgi:exodeoxyribonuclease V alpha subunit
MDAGRAAFWRKAVASTVEITAIIERERIRFDEVAIFDAIELGGNGIEESSFSAKINCVPDDIDPGLTYRLFGSWTSYTNKRTGRNEKQFAVKTWVRAQPHDRAGTMAYLRRAGEGNGVGPAKVAKAWESWGSDAVMICREKPGIVAATLKIKPEQAEAISRWLQRDKDVEAATIDLLSLFDGRGFPRNIVRDLIREHGNRAREIVERNPYVLMKYVGVGFSRADQLWLQLGLPAGRLKRQALCAWHAIASDSTGHTWFKIEQAAQAIHAAISGASPNPVKALRLARRAGLIDVYRNGETWVAEKSKGKHEESIAESIAQLQARSIAEWPVDVACLPVSEHQQQQLAKSLSGPVGLLLGGPGTGKTYTSAALIRAIEASVGIEQVAIAAPTGKAAVRLSQAMASNGVSVQAQTIHSLLRVQSMSGGQWRFEHNAGNRLPFGFVIVDESSMIDAGLMSCLLEAVPTGAKVLFVGDPNQLPPVGHGAPLRDFIAAGIPAGELTEIRRNSGRIVTACHEIRQGKVFQSSQRFSPKPEEGEPENLKIVHASSQTEQIDKMFRVLDIIRQEGFDPVAECQIIAAVNEKGELSRRNLNRILQAKLNTNPAVPKTPFRVGDKVVCLKNAGHEVIDDTGSKSTKYVANGEQGVAVEVSEKVFAVRLVDGTIVRVLRGSESKTGGEQSESEDQSSTGCHWDLAYCVSCHKSQGSEWPFVIVMLDDSGPARQVCSREWIYTAISRAKFGCFLVGQFTTAMQMVRRVALEKRKTFLVDRIHAATASWASPEGVA